MDLPSKCIRTRMWLGRVGGRAPVPVMERSKVKGGLVGPELHLKDQ